MSIRAKSKSNFINTIAGRFAFVVGFFVLWILLIGGKLVSLQVYQADELQAKAARQRLRERRTQPLRGSIFDRAGVELAITLEQSSLVADPRQVVEVEKTAFALAALLGEKPKDLLNKLRDAKENPKTQFLWLGRELSKETADKIEARIKEAKLTGLRWQNEQKRFYPHQTLASHIIGHTNLDDNGQSGIEKTQDKILRGEAGKVISEKDGDGNVYQQEEIQRQQPQDVFLTIDYAIQNRVEQALALGIQTAKAHAGTVVVMRPQTGEILAMATAPTFDLNKVGETAPEILTNRTVQSLYEPGSTFKLITYSAGIEEGLISPTEDIDCNPGFIKIGTRTINDSHKIGKVSFTQAFAKSSNVAAIRIAQEVGRDKMFDYAKKFGYGEPTGVELPLETRGIMKQPDKWSENSLASTAIGYEIAVTTLQSAAAFATVANNGIKVQPHLIKQIQESESKKVVFRENPASNRIISEETARRMQKMLQTVTEQGGTATRAHLNGYTAAGKTGTAHKIGEKMREKKDGTKSLYSNDVVASFVGFAPAENPQVVIAVMLDAPQVGANHGGDVAAPIFKDIAEQILPTLNVAPDSDIKEVKPAEIAVAKTEVKTDKKNTPKSDDDKTDKADKDYVPQGLTEKDVSDERPATIKLEKKGEKDTNAKVKSPTINAPVKTPAKSEKSGEPSAKNKLTGNEPRPRNPEISVTTKPKLPPNVPTPKPKANVPTTSTNQPKPKSKT